MSALGRRAERPIFRPCRKVPCHRPGRAEQPGDEGYLSSPGYLLSGRARRDLSRRVDAPCLGLIRGVVRLSRVDLGDLAVRIWAGLRQWVASVFVGQSADGAVLPSRRHPAVGSLWFGRSPALPCSGTTRPQQLGRNEDERFWYPNAVGSTAKQTRGAQGGGRGGGGRRDWRVGQEPRRQDRPPARIAPVPGASAGNGHDAPHRAHRGPHAGEPLLRQPAGHARPP